MYVLVVLCTSVYVHLLLCSLQKSDRDLLVDEATRRELVRGLNDKVMEMDKDIDSIKR